jgi:hypothetical protein
MFFAKECSLPLEMFSMKIGLNRQCAQSIVTNNVCNHNDDQIKRSVRYVICPPDKEDILNMCFQEIIV